MNSLIKRPLYTRRIEKLRDHNVVKILAGIRRSGKSSLLELIKNNLIEDGIKKDNILHYDFSLIENEGKSYQDLYKEILSKVNESRLYIFIDEVQELEGWEKLINSLMSRIDCDIYITGSNAKLLSDNYATYLTGRFAIFKVFPLSFSEFLNFHGIGIEIGNNSSKDKKYRFHSDHFIDINSLFERYIKYGGFPEISRPDLDEETIDILLENLYLTVFVRDILRNTTRNNFDLIERIIKFLFDSIGSLISIQKITDTLISNAVITADKNKKLSRQTIKTYLERIVDAYLFYTAIRYDVKGKSQLTALNKYYTTDTGIRNYVRQFKAEDRGHLLENIVYIELLRRNFTVNVGKIGQQEIDFRAYKNNKEFLIQVTESLKQENVRKREFDPLIKVNAYKKIIITSDTVLPGTVEDDIAIINIVDFLLDPRYLDDDLENI